MTDPPATCHHLPEALVGSTTVAGDWDGILKDLIIIYDNNLKPIPSKNIRKKALARIERVHRKYIQADGKSSLLAWIYYESVNHILANNIENAKAWCQNAIYFQLKIWNESEATDKALVLSGEKILTFRGLVLHVAKRVPCGCLDSLRREAKERPRDATCQGCKTVKLFSEMFQCSACKLQLYCSEACNKKNWKIHKPECRARARMDYLKTGIGNQEPGEET